MVEQNNGQQDPQDAIKRIVRSTESGKFEEIFRQLPPADRDALVRELQKSTNNLAKIHRDLLKQEKERLRESFKLKASETSDRVVEQLFRSRDGYLNFEALDDSSMALLSRPVQELLDCYKNHVANYGKDSIAPLCLNINIMGHLTTYGIFLVGGSGRFGPIKVNTITELRDLLKRLSSSSDLTICRKEERLHTGSLIGYYPPIHNMQSALINKLRNWDSIRAKFLAQGQPD